MKTRLSPDLGGYHANNGDTIKYLSTVRYKDNDESSNLKYAYSSYHVLPYFLTTCNRTLLVLFWVKVNGHPLVKK